MPNPKIYFHSSWNCSFLFFLHFKLVFFLLLSFENLCFNTAECTLNVLKPLVPIVNLLLHLISFVVFFVLIVLVVEAESFHSWNPTWVLFFQEREYNRLYTSELRAVLRVQMDDVEHVLPEVVIVLNVLVETALATFAVVVEDKFLDVADIADVLHVIVISTNGVSQRGEGVNNNTENNVQARDIDNNLETSIMHKLDQVLLLIVFVMDNRSNITNTTTHPHSFVQHGDIALEHVRAIVLSDNI
jgi:hypothetical protein